MRKLRLLKKKTQAQLANECVVSTSFYGHIERGSRKASLETLLSISIALDTTTDYLIKGKNRMPHGSMGVLNNEGLALRMASDTPVR
ncbi:helix-turn-helix domain-containing protein, partial [Eubacteriales bacterium OttesenSCG-928-A19]|nr:helix-turn-helix domain-containing protein [Eubacteriales bacterium OttesenSCG-928-A19]